MKTTGKNIEQSLRSAIHASGPAWNKYQNAMRKNKICIAGFPQSSHIETDSCVVANSFIERMVTNA